MPKLIDLTTTLDPAKRDLLPKEMAMAAAVLAPKIEYRHPAARLVAFVN